MVDPLATQRIERRPASRNLPGPGFPKLGLPDFSRGKFPSRKKSRGEFSGIRNGVRSGAEKARGGIARSGQTRSGQANPEIRQYPAPGKPARRVKRRKRTGSGIASRVLKRVSAFGTALLFDLPARFRVAWRRKQPRNRAPKKNAGPATTFLKSIFPLTLLLAAGIWFFLFAGVFPSENVSFGELLAGFSRPAGPSGNLRALVQDPLLIRGMAESAGILPELRALEGEDDPLPFKLQETFQWQSYRVRAGDSVEKIARDHGISIDAVIAGNGLTNANRLIQGQEIRLPNIDGVPYTVKRGDSLQKIAAQVNVPVEAILDANDLDTDVVATGTVLFLPGAKMRREDLNLALGGLFAWPLRGRLSSTFGWRKDPVHGEVTRFHDAIDIPAATGTPVKAAQDGSVESRGYNSKYGNYVIIAHTGGYTTLYAHLSRVEVREGERVLRGTKIGEAGNTGYSTGPHLHFAIYKNGRAVNPLDFLRQ